MRILVRILFITIFLSGCGSVEELDDRWAPLKAVKESSIQSPDVVTTLVPYVVVSDLDGWQDTYPIGSLQREAILRHERVHAFRQLKYGLAKYLIKYVNDPEFRWREEQLANYVEFMYMRERGFKMDVERKARFLSGSTYLNMVSYDEAIQWFKDVESGAWKPDGELPAPVEDK